MEDKTNDSWSALRTKFVPNFEEAWKKKYTKRFIMDYPAIDSDYREAVKDFIQETINSLLDELKMEKKSVDELSFIMGSSYTDLCVKVAFKEGHNQAVDDFDKKLERFRDGTK